MYYQYFILALCCAIGPTCKDAAHAAGPRLEVLRNENHFKNSSPTFHQESRGIPEQKIAFKPPELYGAVRRKKQSIFPNQREYYMSADPKHDLGQIRINNPYSISGQQHIRRKVTENSSISAKSPNFLRESHFKTQKNKNDSDSPRGHPTLKSYQNNRKNTVQTRIGMNDSFPGGTTKIDSVSAEACRSKHTLDACLAKATTTTPALRGLPHTPAQLQLMCQLFKGGMRCVDDYTTRCLAPEKRALLEDNIVGARSFLAFLCDDPSFQRDYLSHALCMKAVSAHWDDCYLHFQYLLRLELRATADSSFDAMCCVRQKFLMCVDEAADISCNMDDALFLRKVTATLSYAEHRTLMCQREYSCSGGQATSEWITGQLELTALLLSGTWFWSQKNSG